MEQNKKDFGYALDEKGKTTITLEKKVDEKALYYIDWSTLEKVEDLITLLACIGFSFSPTHPHWNLLERFVDINNPIYPNQPPQKHEPILPKLKKVK